MKFVILFFYLPLFLVSQETVFDNYDWEANPKYINGSDYENSKNVVILKDFRIFELVSNKEGAFEYILTHSIKKVNTDNGIESSNKIYISENSNRKIISHKMRVINSDGKIILLDQSDIQEAIDQTTKVKYQYYAVRGLEKGSVIEQIIVTKNTSGFDGKLIPIQSSNFAKNIEIRVVYPNHLVYALKSYNNAPKFVQNDSMYPTKIAQIFKLDSCEELDEEKYSNYNANLMTVAYKLVGNNASYKLNMNSFKSIGENIYGEVYKELDKKSLEELSLFCSKISFQASSSLKDSIVMIERFLKNEIIFIDKYSSESRSLSETFKSKKANAQNLFILYANVYKYFSIPHEIVLTNSRYNFPFDGKFEIVSQLNEYLLYFPNDKGFLCPHAQDNRYPIYPYGFGENDGLFIKTLNLGGSEVIMSYIKKIDFPLMYDEDSLNIDIDFTANVRNPNFTISNTLKGYDAQSTQFVLDLMDEKQKKEFAEEYMKNYTGETESSNTILYFGKQNIGVNPLIITASFSSNKLIEKNADNILFKIGESIGRQDELYQEKTRRTSVESTYPRTYKRRIYVKIPEGYKFENLDGLKMDFDVIENGKSMAGFHSDYILENGQLVITINEYYLKIKFPIELYDKYKSVINAAADFNKVKVIISQVD